MSREEVFADIERVFGFVPELFQRLSDEALGNQWRVISLFFSGNGRSKKKEKE